METEILTQAGLTVASVIYLSNILTGYTKFIIPEDSKFRVELVRLLSLGWAMTLTAVIGISLGSEAPALVAGIISVIGAIGANNLHERNSEPPVASDDELPPYEGKRI